MLTCQHLIYILISVYTSYWSLSVHDIISRDIRRFIRQNGRYRFVKLYELIQRNSSLEHISDLLEIDQDSIMHWKTIFEMIGSDGIPKFDSPFPDIEETVTLKVIVNEDPSPSTIDKETRKKNFTIH